MPGLIFHTKASWIFRGLCYFSKYVIRWQVLAETELTEEEYLEVFMKAGEK
jgi:hypothetical protein